MGGYLPSTAAERKEMLAEIGADSMDALFCAVPDEVRAGALHLPAGKSEQEVRDSLETLAEKNQRFHSIFRGAGAYAHYIPAIVRSVTAKEAFVTAYTPYQAEISQGVLQSIFEYQTMLCELTGMAVSNASVYDGATAAAEAVFLCRERRRDRVVVSGALHPQVLQTVQTYCASRGVPVTVVPAENGATDPTAIADALTEDTACVLFQQPNFFGVVEDATALVDAAHAARAKAVMSVNPISLGLLQTPGECGADVAVGEGQPLGLPLGFGGPYLGFMACTEPLMRRLPGRIVGQTEDPNGSRAFVLTLQAREQHIRREKASSNICSNEALCAMTASVYLAAMGPQGLAEAATQCCAKAHYLAEKLEEIGFSRLHDRPFFHEFVTTCPINPQVLEQALAARGILCGLPVEGGLLWCVTEKNTRAQMDALTEAIGEVLKQ